MNQMPRQQNGQYSESGEQKGSSNRKPNCLAAERKRNKGPCNVHEERHAKVVKGVNAAEVWSVEHRAGIQ